MFRNTEQKALTMLKIKGDENNRPKLPKHFSDGITRFEELLSVRSGQLGMNTESLTVLLVMLEEVDKLRTLLEDRIAGAKTNDCAEDEPKQEEVSVDDDTKTLPAPVAKPKKRGRPPKGK